jgi:hypothetical protein
VRLTAGRRDIHVSRSEEEQADSIFEQYRLLKYLMHEEHERLKLLKDKSKEATRDAGGIREKSYIFAIF